MRKLLVLVLSLVISCTYLPVYAGSYDPYSTSVWWHDYMDVQEAWDLIDATVGPGKPKVKIASVDTGVSRNNPDMVANLDIYNSVHISMGHTTHYSTPKFSHGSNVSSLICAESNNGIGIAGTAAGNRNKISEIMCIDVSCHLSDVYSDVDYKSTTTDDILAGLYYAAENGARVIHTCLGHDQNTLDFNGNHFDTEKIQNAISDIKSQYDVVFIAAAGNQNSTEIRYTSDYKDVINVINLVHYKDAHSQNVKHHGSSYGQNKFLAAPGTDITFLDMFGSVATGTGTSYSSALVAGVAALVRYANPDLTAKEVEDILISTTDDLYEKGFDIYTAYGKINAYNAVAKALKKAGYKDFPDRLSVPKLQRSVSNLKAKSPKKKVIKLTWTKSSSDSGYINGYKILRSTSKKGKYKKIRTVNSTSCTIGGLKSKKTYYFKVQPYGTTYDGKKMVAASCPSSKAVRIKCK